MRKLLTALLFTLLLALPAQAQIMPMVSPTHPAATDFQAFSWTGTGASQVISAGVSFSPDLVLVIDISGGGGSYLAESSIIGTGKYLTLHSTAAMQTDAASITAFNGNGFTLGGSLMNTSTVNYQGFAWRKLSGYMDVQQYTGTRPTPLAVNHNLGVVPQYALILPETSANKIEMNANAATSNAWQNAYWNNSAHQMDGIINDSTLINGVPTSSVFNLGSDSNDFVNRTNANLMVLFAQLTGYSSFGTYTGNGSTTGPSVSTGFLPSCVIVQVQAATANTPYIALNSSGSGVFYALSAPNTTSTGSLTFSSSGFQLTTTNANMNSSGVTYTYAAWK